MKVSGNARSPGSKHFGRDDGQRPAARRDQLGTREDEGDGYAQAVGKQLGSVMDAGSGIA